VGERKFFARSPFLYTKTGLNIAYRMIL